MIDFNKAIELIRMNGGFTTNSHDSSYYRVYKMQGSKPIQVRISDHGTHLWTWYDRDYDPSSAINICIVFSEDGNYVSNTKVDMRIKDNIGNVVSERKPFEVIQYVYNCKMLDRSDAALINQSVQSIWQNKVFKDPLANTPKHAKIMRLKPNESVEIITENKTYNTMKRYIIRKGQTIDESELNRIIDNRVRVVLEAENPFTVPLRSELSPYAQICQGLYELGNTVRAAIRNAKNKSEKDYYMSIYKELENINDKYIEKQPMDD